MPRQDVPYGGAICRLRERIAEIFDKLGEKLHTINGVPGDGDGNVKIVSGSSAVVINNDPTQNEIAVSLDTSQLPAASVASVNGQTGAVALDAGDIPSDNGDVQTDIDNLEAADTTLQGNINAEALARQNADSTLQTNINAATAGIPTEISNQLAADTTIVRTSGNQNIGDIKTVATQATGSYSQQIANSQKVKNELDNYAPMLRTSGNQTGAGIKTIAEIRQRTYYSTLHFNMTVDLASGVYQCIYKSNLTSETDRNILFMWNNTRKGISPQVAQCGLISAGGRPTTISMANVCGTVPTNHFAMTRKVIDSSNTEIAIWCTGQIKVFDVLFEGIGYNNVPAFSVDGVTTTNDFSTYDQVIYL